MNVVAHADYNPILPLDGGRERVDSRILFLVNIYPKDRIIIFRDRDINVWRWQMTWSFAKGHAWRAKPFRVNRIDKLDRFQPLSNTSRKMQ